MRIEVNGDSHELDVASLSEVVDRLGLGEATIATALNGAFVPRGERADTRLKPGDRIEILGPMQGG